MFKINKREAYAAQHMEFGQCLQLQMDYNL